MKKCFFTYFFFIFLTSYAFAGTTTLTTYYPPPTAAYKQVNLSTSAPAIPSTNNIANYASTNCPTHVGATFSDTSNPPNYYTCTAVTPYYTTANGIVHADNTGTLHVIMNNGQDLVYPQQCYNRFCSYTGAITPACSNYLSNTAGNCPNGFNQFPVNHFGTVWSDTFQTSPTTTVVSIVCCTTIYNSTLPTPDTTYPEDETTTTTTYP